MKIRLSTMFVFWIYVFAVTAQNSTDTTALAIPYQSLNKFNNDKGAYLETNFDKRSGCYKGKTFGEMMSDMEISPIGYEYAFIVNTNKTKVPCIDLIFKHASNSTYSPLKDIYISIYFETPFDILEFESIKQYPKSNWVSQHADFFRNKVIKSIEYNPYIKYLRDKESIMPKERPAL